MGDSRRELIIQHCEELLSGAIVPTGLAVGAAMPAGLAVHRSRARPIDKDSLPATVIYEVSEPAERVGGSRGPIYRESLLLRFEHRVEGPKDAPAYALDPLINWCVQVMMADERLGGLALGVQKKGTAWNPNAQLIRETFASASTDFVIDHQTLAKNPEAKS